MYRKSLYIVVLGCVAIPLLAGAIGFCFFWNERNPKDILSTVGGVLGGGLLGFLMVRVFLLTPPARVYLTKKELIYRKKKAPLDKIRHLRIVIREGKVSVVDLSFKVVYEKNGKEDEINIPMARSINLLVMPTGFPRKLVQTLIDKRGKKGVGQEVFNFLNQGKVEKWQSYLRKNKLKRQLAGLFLLGLVFLGTPEVRIIGVGCFLLGFILLIKDKLKS